MLTKAKIDYSGITKDEILQESETLVCPKETTAQELLMEKIESIPCLVSPLFPKVGLASLAGGSDVGKSSLLRQLAIALSARESQFLGFPIYAKHHSAIYVSTEDERLATSFLLNRQNRGKGFQPEQLKSLRYVFDTHDLLNELEMRLTANPADLVILDAFSDLYGKSMNDTNQVRFFLNDYSQLAQKHQCLIIFLHHVGKRREDETPTKHNLLGSQGFEAKMRLVIELRTDQNTPEHRHFCIVKGNYLSSEYKRESYVLRFDENMLFQNTGERESFQLLQKINIDHESKAKYEQAKELKEKGLTYDQIAKELGFKSKGTITKLFQKFEHE